VGVGKGHSHLGKSVEVGRDRVRMAAKRADPVVQVIDDDEENVRLLGLDRDGTK
jgi:hypothetical protein